jgi:hypothetical protein
MRIQFTEEEKKIFKRTAILAKSFKPSEPKVYTMVQIDQMGSLDHSWEGPIVTIGSSHNGRDIDYESYYNMIYEFISNRKDHFMDPFDSYDESWGTIISVFDYGNNTLNFGYTVSYYESESQDSSDVLTGDKAQKLINFKNNSEHLQGNIIRMSFDGGGDDGHIDENGENETGDQIIIPDEFTDFGYRVLSREFGGWENNEGGNGHITLDFSKPNQVKYSVDINLNGEEYVSGEYDFNIKLDL